MFDTFGELEHDGNPVEFMTPKVDHKDTFDNNYVQCLFGHHQLDISETILYT